MSDFEQRLIEAQKRFDAMSLEDKQKMRAAQRKSWVIGETMLSHPEMTRGEAEEIYEKVVVGVGL
jgi:hypothetical protein